MSRQNWWTILRAVSLTVMVGWQSAAARDSEAVDGSISNHSPAAGVDLFSAMDDGQADVKFIAKNDRAARILITNKTKQPLHLQLPEAFAGVPVLAQFGGGGGGRGGGGFGGGGGGLGGGGGGQQSVGGGLGGGGGGGLGGGGGGGIFSIPPEQTAKLNVAVVCLDHGLRNPSSSTKYTIVPAEEHLVDRPAVIELLKAFGRGELQHGATQAAAWHLNSGLTWNELAAKLQGTRRSLSRPPYFNRQEIQAGMAYASAAHRLAAANAELYERDKEQKAQRVEAAEMAASDQRSTSNDDAREPETADDQQE